MHTIRHYYCQLPNYRVDFIGGMFVFLQDGGLL